MFQSFMERMAELNIYSVAFRLFLSALLGGIIGIERGRKGRAAGLRTHMIVCIGATLVMMTNLYIMQMYGTSDPSRMGAQVVSGIGFLGAGTIIVDRQHHVRGLTTAAGLWASACMGLALGIGFYAGAMFAGGAIFCIIKFVELIETRVAVNSVRLEVYAEFMEYRDVNAFIESAQKTSVRVINVEIVTPQNNAEQANAAAIFFLQVPRGVRDVVQLPALKNAQGLVHIEEY